jgi:hypothetical protein
VKTQRHRGNREKKGKRLKVMEEMEKPKGLKLF